MHTPYLISWAYLAILAMAYELAAHLEAWLRGATFRPDHPHEDMLISNSYGIPKALHLNRSRLDYFVPLMGPSLGTRLMFGIYTYAEETFVSITSLKSVVSDIERLSDLVQESFDDLERAASGSTGPADKPKQPRSRAKKAKKASKTARRRSAQRISA